MLTFSDTAWHAVSNLIVFLIGCWVAIVQVRTFAVRQKQAILFYLWHTGFSIFYFYYSLNGGSDSANYYIFSFSDSLDFAFGTIGIYYLTSFFSLGMGMSYGGTFLVYNLFGFIGMLAFAAALRQVAAACGKIAQRLSLLLILLPGLSFWSSAIGKDALTFMAAGLATWGALNNRRRYPALILAALAFLLARPHMAGILLVSVTLAVLFSQRIGLIKRVVLLALMIPTAFAGVGFGLEYAGLEDASSIADVNNYFELRQGYNLGGGSSVDIASMSVPMRLVTYLFRPFFFDAGGMLGLVISVENTLLAAVILYAITMRLGGRRSQLDLFPFIFFVVFSTVSWLVLANTTANLGIAIRQKWMFLPMMLVLAYSYVFRPRVT